MAAQEGPPGYDPELDAKPKTKSAKRNARKKEKRLQAAFEKDKSSGSVEDEDTKVEDEKVVQSLTSQIDKLAVCANPDGGIPPSGVTEGATLGGSGQDIDKKIRAPKKKIHLVEAQLQKTPHIHAKQEQVDKLSKLKGWREELRLLEKEKAEG